MDAVVEAVEVTSRETGFKLKAIKEIVKMMVTVAATRTTTPEVVTVAAEATQIRTGSTIRVEDNPSPTAATPSTVMIRAREVRGR